jgi:hypothetical protein
MIEPLSFDGWTRDVVCWALERSSFVDWPTEPMPQTRERFVWAVVETAKRMPPQETPLAEWWWYLESMMNGFGLRWEDAAVAWGWSASLVFMEGEHAARTNLHPDDWEDLRQWTPRYQTPRVAAWGLGVLSWNALVFAFEELQFQQTGMATELPLREQETVE